jgi:hypothetical protein
VLPLLVRMDASGFSVEKTTALEALVPQGAWIQRQVLGSCCHLF